MKQFSTSRFASRIATLATQNSRRTYGQVSLANLLTILCVGIALCLSTVQATAICAATDEVSIFLYDSNGNAINVSATDSYQEPIIIDAAGNTIGTVEANDDIVNSAGTVIGFITESAD